MSAFTANGAASTIAEPRPSTKRGIAESPFEAGVINTVFDVQRAFFRMMSNVLVNSDYAWRSNRSYQRMMRQDPDVMSPLLQRQTAVALLDWNVVPEDAEDELQVEQARHLQKIIDRMRGRHDFIRHLSESVWYGCSGVNPIYSRGPMGFAPKTWIPFHPDTLQFDATGNVGILVGPDYKGETIVGHIGRVHIFTEEERRAFVFHRSLVQAPDYEVPEESRYMFAGRGLRDIVWLFWTFKQIALQNWMKWVERYSLGLRIGRFPHGDSEAQASIERVLHNLVSDVSVTLPRTPNENPDAFDIDIKEVGGAGTGNKAIADLIDGYLAGQIKELIIGQTATTEPTSAGLGEGTSTRHAETFQRLIKYDALTLADSLTHDFVEQLHVLNFGDTEWRPRFEPVVEDIDSEEFMSGVEKFINLGGRVPEAQVRNRLGIDEPRDDERVLELQQPDPFGMGLGGEDMGDGGGEAFARARRRFVRGVAREMFAVPWDESKHPRGQPENAGQFGPGGGGKKSMAASGKGGSGPAPSAAVKHFVTSLATDEYLLGIKPDKQMLAKIKRIPGAMDHYRATLAGLKKKTAAKEKVKKQIETLLESINNAPVGPYTRHDDEDAQIIGHASLKDVDIDMLKDDVPEKAFVDHLIKYSAPPPWKTELNETISEYSGSAYSDWNAAFRTCRESKDIQRCLETDGDLFEGDAADILSLNEHLKKMKWEKPIRVFRGFAGQRSGESKKLLDAMKVGETVTMDGFVSTSIDPKVAFGFVSHLDDRKSAAVFEIEARRGAYISKPGQLNEEEREFLQPHGTRYRVKHSGTIKTTGGLKARHIILEEIE